MKKPIDTRYAILDARRRMRRQPPLRVSSIRHPASRVRSGFVLLVVILVMAIIGIEMSILGSIANTMQFQSQTAYLQACRRNLTASGLAWARQNIPNKAGEGVPGAIKLSTGEMDIRGSELDLTISRPPEKEAEVLIKTSCSRGRQMLKGEYRYKLSL